MTSSKARQWVVRMLLAAGVILALVAAAPEAEAGFRLSVGTNGFYFAVGHHDYYPYYSQPARHGRYASTAFSFHDTLNDYGYWQYAPEMGVEVWIPYVEYGWRPFTYGHWAYSPYGFTWVSYEPWGWIPHHYGNWTYVDYYGWAWVPGYTWRPHSVNFALVNGYVGWAPVAPPWYRYSYNRGYRYYGDRGWYSGWRHGHQRYDYSGIDYSAYVFVDNRNFYSTGIYNNVLLPGRGADMFRAGQVMPLGDTLDLGYVKRVTGRSITPVALDRQVYRVNGSEVVHYQPRGQEELVRRAALPTVNKALAPGFQKHGVSFKGTSAQSAGAVNSMFKQGNMAPKTTVFTRSAVSSGMSNDAYYQKQKRTLDNLAQTRSSKTGTAAGASSKGKSSPGKTRRASNSGSSSAAVTSGRSSGYKPRTGSTAGKSRAVNNGSSSSSRNRSASKPPATRSRSVNSGASSSGKSRAVNSGSSSSSRNRSASKPPATGSRSTQRSKPPASTRSASRPPQGKPSKPAGTSSTRSGSSRGKSSGKPAGKPSGKSSSNGKSDGKGKPGKRG